MNKNFILFLAILIPCTISADTNQCIQDCGTALDNCSKSCNDKYPCNWRQDCKPGTGRCSDACKSHNACVNVCSDNNQKCIEVC